jgi:hypothetical protein
MMAVHRERRRKCGSRIVTDYSFTLQPNTPGRNPLAAVLVQEAYASCFPL